ncbi:ABC transporter ATP-binding protein [Suttonella sp. R2A3]|uniref:dipeptide ABC transporter ATP-binding protein n=1 Tax=Suttonella sp. R2A3 TaxID=2908648 RepID=UPI001F170DBC|nr:ABC transporter ATP-binding protein [Suttonella sp. R2A3]UJF23924.1 ABC transporter ATP-binding protein [Suttonella sp. R2A3]
MSATPLLSVSDLHVVYPSRHGDFTAVDHVSFELYRGEILGIVGESGAGKSTIGNAIADLLTPPGYVAGGEVSLDGKDLRALSSDEMRRLRGKDIGFIFQDPMTSLNPLLTIGEQLMEPMFAYLDVSRNEAKKRAIDLLNAVGIADPEVRLRQYPHQFSGGMRQRVVIAIALSTEPKFIIADEPTTALDVSIQDQILQLLRQLCREKDVGCMLVTHDMGVVASVTDRVMVTYRGKRMEIGSTEQVLRQPENEYTKSLISAVPPSNIKLDRFPLVTYIEEAGERANLDLKTHWLGRQQEIPQYDGPILRVEDISLRFVTRQSVFKHLRRYVQAIDHVSFNIEVGETFGLVGESGSGKSTTARAITGLHPPQSGKIFFEGQDLTALTWEKARLPMRRQMQMVFQNPYSSVNPRMRVKDIIAEPIRFHKLADSPQQVQSIVRDLIEHVGLARDAGDKFPHEFSGGQRQRISIARALATRPRLLICDEPTSALDVSVQAQILNLLKDLQAELNLTMLFISHDLPVIRQMCDRIGVMRQGQLVEVNDTNQLFEHASDPYTRELIELMPRFDRVPGTTSLA